MLLGANARAPSGRIAPTPVYVRSYNFRHPALRTQVMQQQPQARPMQAIENQFRAALAFAYTFVIARLLGAVMTGHDVSVIAVIATYVLLGVVALGLRRSMSPDTDEKYARMMTYVTLGALAATAPEFW